LDLELKKWYKCYRKASLEFDVISTRAERMRKKNPRFILRNSLVNEVISEAQSGDYESVNWYLRLLQNPFDEGTIEDQKRFGGMVPDRSRNLKCSCSS
jgi:uncharacterized protein YdiU (UPF0061 family)